MTGIKVESNFAESCLLDMKRLLARKIRMHINKNELLYKQAAEMFNVSISTVCKIMNYREDSVSFDTLHNAAVSSGMTVSVSVTEPD